jgi:hypothetical protein
MLQDEDLPALFELPTVLVDVDRLCLAGDTYGVSCLRDAVTQGATGAFASRERALHLLTAVANRDRVLSEKALIDLVQPAEADPRLLVPLSFAFVKLRPVCSAPPDAPCSSTQGCSVVRCDRIRFSGGLPPEACGAPPLPPLPAPPPAPPAAPPAVPPPAAPAADAAADAGAPAPADAGPG